MHAVWIWGAALLLYAGFTLWYVNWRGPLTAPEIEVLLARLEAQSAIEPERMASVRRFLEADDGREFFMVNVIRLQPEPVAMPGTGELAPPRQVLQGYTAPFMRALFLRAGHPAFAGPAAGRYLEQWGVEADPGWSFSGIIRYRSRRDMAELASAPEFEPAHVFKRAAMERTFAFPVAPAMLFFGPRVWVALALGLVAALAQLALNALGARG